MAQWLHRVQCHSNWRIRRKVAPREKWLRSSCLGIDPLEISLKSRTVLMSESILSIRKDLINVDLANTIKAQCGDKKTRLIKFLLKKKTTTNCSINTSASFDSLIQLHPIFDRIEDGIYKEILVILRNGICILVNVTLSRLQVLSRWLSCSRRCKWHQTHECTSLW